MGRFVESDRLHANCDLPGKETSAVCVDTGRWILLPFSRREFFRSFERRDADICAGSPALGSSIVCKTPVQGRSTLSDVDVYGNPAYDLDTQAVAAFEGANAIFKARCACGANGTETPLGEYLTYHKGQSVPMTNQGDGTENTYYLLAVQWISFLRERALRFTEHTDIIIITIGQGTRVQDIVGGWHPRGEAKKKKETPVIVYFWTLGLAILGYTLSNVGLSGLPHTYHWTTGILGAIVGFGIGWVWYRWRGDII